MINYIELNFINNYLLYIGFLCILLLIVFFLLAKKIELFKKKLIIVVSITLLVEMLLLKYIFIIFAIVYLFFWKLIKIKYSLLKGLILLAMFFGVVLIIIDLPLEVSLITHKNLLVYYGQSIEYIPLSDIHSIRIIAEQKEFTTSYNYLIEYKGGKINFEIEKIFLNLESGTQLAEKIVYKSQLIESLNGPEIYFWIKNLK